MGKKISFLLTSLKSTFLLRTQEESMFNSCGKGIYFMQKYGLKAKTSVPISFDGSTRRHYTT